MSNLCNNVYILKSYQSTADSLAQLCVMPQSQHIARVLPSNKLSYFCNLTLLCVTSQRMPDALTIFVYNRPFFNITYPSEAPRGYFPEATDEDTCKLM